MKRFSFHRLSIRLRLTLLISFFLLSVILIFGSISYLSIKKTSLKVGEDRLKSLSEQLTTMLSANVHNTISSTYKTANKPAIKKFILSNGKDSVNESLKLLQELKKDSQNVQVELRNTNHLSLLKLTTDSTPIHFNINSIITSTGSGQIDSGTVGNLYLSNNSLYYPIVVTITEQNKLLGYVVRWRKMANSSKGVEQLSKLMGTDGNLYIGNTDGTLWTDMIKPVSAIPIVYNPKSNKVNYFSSNNKEVLVSVSPIKGSKWLFAIEMSKGRILEAADRFLNWMIITALTLLAIGFFIAWKLSRSITRPLRDLTNATTGIASGNYHTLVQAKRNDEIGELANAFNSMAVQVHNSQQELQKKAENYKMLFESNPMPMWIISLPTLEIKNVNRAAIDHYGYSRDEFLNMNSKDMRPKEDVDKYVATITKYEEENKHTIWRHRKKDGSIIMVEVITDTIKYEEQEAKLILANDVTEKLKAEAELVRHRFMKQQLITETTIQAQEKEREELAKELHDNINQILTSTKLYLEMAIENNKEFARDAVSKSYENVKRVIGEIRQLSKQLVPPSLGTTLIDGITDLCHEIQSLTPIKITIDSEGFSEKIMNDNLKLMVYRIIQEQVNNILKHAAASKVFISILNDDKDIHLTIVDNGVGFDTSKKSKGIGLRNIDNRVKFQNGTAFISSQIGKGCRLAISIPYTRVEDRLAI